MTVEATGDTFCTRMRALRPLGAKPRQEWSNLQQIWKILRLLLIFHFSASQD